MRVLFPGIEDHPVLRELEVTPASLSRLPTGDLGPGFPRKRLTARRVWSEEQKSPVEAPAPQGHSERETHGQGGHPGSSG